MAETRYVYSPEDDPYRLSAWNTALPRQHAAYKFYESFGNWADVDKFVKHQISRTTEELDTLEPDIKEKFIKLFQLAFAEGFLPLLIEGKRSFERSQRLYEEYKRTGENVAAPAGKSFHNYGQAGDWAIYSYSGNDFMAGGTTTLNKIAEENDLGLRWGIGWGDPPHFENANYTLKQLQNASDEYDDWINLTDQGRAQRMDDEAIDRQKEEVEEKKTLISGKKWIAPTLIGIVAIGIITTIVFLVRREQ